MSMIAVDDLVSEMILASDLRTVQGRFLLPGGTVLTDDHLRTFKTWGIIEADIEGVSEEDVEDCKRSKIDPEILEMSQKLADRRFTLADRDSEAMLELSKLFVMRTSNRIAQVGIEAFLSEQDELESDPGLDSRSDSLQKINPAFILRNEIELASLPDIYIQIVDAIKNPRSSAAFVADIISNDMSLSAKLLRLVNSAFYGFPSQIDTLSRAVTIIGTNQLTTLALGVSVTTMFKDIPAGLIDMKSFWKHSIVCGIISRHIAGQIKNVSEERFFVAGLLHDIGRLVMLKSYPAHVKEALLQAGERKVLLCSVESELWGFDHAELAGELLKNWKFPSILEDSIHFHHAPRRARSILEPGIVHLADIMANALMIGNSGNRFVPPFDPEVWEMLGLSKSVIPMIVTQVDHQIDELMRIFFKSDG